VEPREAVQPRILDPLDANGLSTLYGKGFALLQRMGFVPGAHGLRKDSLQAPLKAHDQGASRRGVQSSEENVQFAPTGASAAVGASRPFSQLLQDALASMREAGDDEEAEDLRRLASAVGLTNNVLEDDSGFRFSKRRRASSSKRRRASSDDSSSGSGTSMPAGSGQGSRAAPRSALQQEAMDAVLQGIRGDANFPVEIAKQPQQLRWASRWKRRLGDYEAFVRRQSDAACIIHCPAPHGGKLLLPRHGASTRSAGRYAAWCHGQRLAAKGRAKRKWRHVEKMVARCFRSQSRSEQPAADLEETGSADVVQPAEDQADVEDAESCGSGDVVPSVEAEAESLGWWEDGEGDPAAQASQASL